MLYPEQRRFAPDETDCTVLSSVTMKTSEQRKILESRHGTAVLTQDVYNTMRRMNVGKAQGCKDSESCEEILKEVVANGGYGEVGKDDTGAFLFAAFVTRPMRAMLNAFPECLIMDATYKVNHYLYPLLTIMVLNGEGHGMPVFHAFLAKEDKIIIEQCLRIFQKLFDSEKTTCFVIDKDMAEQAALGAVFPDVPVNLCHFHISQAVERYLRKELGRGTAAVKKVLELFMCQLYTESLEEFSLFKEEISRIVPQSVVAYFQDNWWGKKDLWAACCNVNVVKLHATTTNTLESYHSKIKKVVNEKLSLANAFSAIVSFDNDKILESNRKQLLLSNCCVSDASDVDATEVAITRSLTRFAATLVKAELSLSRSVDYLIAPAEETGSYDVSYKENNNKATHESCTCSTYGKMRFPCRHIFVVRDYLRIGLYDVATVPERYQQATAVTDLTVGSTPVTSINMSTYPSRPVSHKTVDGRYRTARGVCDELANFLSILGQEEFEEKLEELKSLVRGWATGHHVTDVSAPNNDTNNVVAVENDADDDVPEAVLVVGGADEELAPNTNCIQNSPDPSQSNALQSITDVSFTLSAQPLTVVDQSSGDLQGYVDLHAVVNDDLVTECTSLMESETWPTMSRLIKPRGRPGNRQAFTKKRSSVKRCRELPKVFLELSLKEKCNLLVSAVSCHTSVPQHIITRSEIKSHTDFGDIVLDDKIDMGIIKEYIEPSTWEVVLDGVASRVEDGLFYCGQCKELDDMEFKMIQCERCLIWHDFHCVGYSSKKRVETWFCETCLTK